MLKDEARSKIAEVIAKYQALSASAIKSTNEQATINGFINPLFTALGWDPCDINEVAPEHAASGGRVDLAFRLNGVSQFFLEAKKFSADLNDPVFVKQAVTYAYNKGVTWAVLTDFQNIRVYNANTGKQFLNLEWAKYATTDYDRLWLLSKESLHTGALNEEAKTYSALPPSVPVEQKLFKQLRVWREVLINDLIGFNDGLNADRADEIVQRLFNRLIFIRTAEDRGIEEPRLRAATHQPNKKDQLLSSLREIFNYYNDQYDSELFKRHDTDSVFITETTIRDILAGLYEIPGGLAEYDFSIIDADVLGAVYEQYLGYVAGIVRRRAEEAQARLALGFSADSQYEVTAKKQHRKEQGIYYTPNFVTDYIVKETVGRYLKEHTFNENRGIKILDPACSSGSFLIRAFDELLDYHAKESGTSPAELSQFERLRILTANIHGVDLDRQAVEIARLNMLLRSLAKRELLPGLKDNIKQGNSLISGTDEELKGYFGDTWKEKRPFNWDSEFQDVMAHGGFDVIIGNPPYIQLSTDEKSQSGLKHFLLDTYKSSMGRLNTFGFFIKRGIDLLKDDGYLGFIVPNTILTQDYYEELRKSILTTCSIEAVATFDTLPFTDAVVENVILILRRGKPEANRTRNKVSIYKMNGEPFFEYEKSIPEELFSQARRYSFNIRTDESSSLLQRKIEGRTLPLSEFVNINQAVALKHERAKWVSDSRVDESYKPLLVGGYNINRYSTEWDKQYLHYDKKGIHSGGDEEKFLAKEKIFFRRVARHLIGTLDTDQFYGLHTLVVMTPRKDNPFDIRFLLALFNSKLLDFYYQLIFASTKTVFSEIGARQVAQLPVKSIDLSLPAEKQMHDNLIALADRMLELNKKLAPVRDVYSQERDDLIAEIEKTDKEIDSLVYKLYGLTEDEIKIVEGS